MNESEQDTLTSPEQFNPDIQNRLDAYVLHLMQMLPNEMAGSLLRILADFEVCFPNGVARDNGLFDNPSFHECNYQELEAMVKNNRGTTMEMVEILRQNPFFQEQLAADAGVSQGYTIGQHLEMVVYMDTLNPESESDLLTQAEFNLLITLHDIGKPAAIAIENDKEKQHIYTVLLVEGILHQINLDARKKKILLCVIDQDWFRELTKEQKPISEVAKEIEAVAKQLAVRSKSLFTLVRKFHFCDAGAYTSWASEGTGQPWTDGLNHLFDIDPESQQLNYSTAIRDKILALETLLEAHSTSAMLEHASSLPLDQ